MIRNLESTAVATTLRRMFRLLTYLLIGMLGRWELSMMVRQNQNSFCQEAEARLACVLKGGSYRSTLRKDARLTDLSSMKAL